MNWNTIYVIGKEGFEHEVLKRLIHSEISYMPGYMSELEKVALFWLDERTTLRDFKKAIGSKTIFKFRLQFYNSLEEVTKKIESDEGLEELKIVA
jgi:hypothetical protein